MKTITIFLTLGLLLCSSADIRSQSTAFLNSAKVINSMPEFDTVKEEVMKYETKLKDDLKFEIDKLQTKYNDWQKSLNTISQEQARTNRAALDKEKQQLFTVEQSIPGSIQQKQQELMKPIYDEINKMVEVIAKEKGFTLVIDTGTGSVVYGDDKVNITQLVIDRINQ